MTYNVSEGRWIGPTLMSMGMAHLVASDRAELGRMARGGWLHSASTPESARALWFAVAGGSLVTMGALAHSLTREGMPMPRSAAVTFTVTMATALTAAGSPGAGVGTLVGLGMYRNARSGNPRR